MSVLTPDCNDLGAQLALNRFYLREIDGPENFQAIPTPAEYVPVHAFEAAWNAYEESRLDLSDLPTDAASFKLWYGRLYRRHRLDVQNFFDHLAAHATPEELAFYIGMEEQIDGRFDDVIAMAQLGMAGDMKLALAENFWDEMGLGDIDGMHTLMFVRSAEKMRVFLDRVGLDMKKIVPAEALKNGNLLLMYALRRQYGPRLLGALAILEHTAPYRFAKCVQGLRRIGMPEDVVYYHEMHIKVDANHGLQLFNRVLLPMVERSPAALREIAIGCLIRYQVAIDYYRSIERTLADLGLSAARVA
jgi:hypothetical protein